MSVAKPVALIILDGFALREEKEGNAVALAHKPNFDRYWNEYPHTILTASGEAVGLPEIDPRWGLFQERNVGRRHPSCPHAREEITSSGTVV